MDRYPTFYSDEPHFLVGLWISKIIEAFLSRRGPLCIDRRIKPLWGRHRYSCHAIRFILWSCSGNCCGRSDRGACHAYAGQNLSQNSKLVQNLGILSKSRSSLFLKNLWDLYTFPWRILRNNDEIANSVCCTKTILCGLKRYSLDFYSTGSTGGAGGASAGASFFIRQQQILKNRLKNASRPAAIINTIFAQLASQKKIAITTIATANKKRQKQSFIDLLPK